MWENTDDTTNLKGGHKILFKQLKLDWKKKCVNE